MNAHRHLRHEHFSLFACGLVISQASTKTRFQSQTSYEWTGLSLSSESFLLLWKALDQKQHCWFCTFSQKAASWQQLRDRVIKTLAPRDSNSVTFSESWRYQIYPAAYKVDIIAPHLKNGYNIPQLPIPASPSRRSTNGTQTTQHICAYLNFNLVTILNNSYIFLIPGSRPSDVLERKSA
jgi:hypothetical protein